MSRILSAAIVLPFALCCIACTADPRQRVLIAGDSTASFYSAKFAPQTGWGQALPYFINDDVVVVNHASSGRSSKSYLAEGRWKIVLREVRPGDTVLISFGHNDARDDTPRRYTQADTEFRDNMIRFAQDVLAKDGMPIILSPAARRLWEGNSMVETHGQYAVNARLAAATAGIDFVDLANLSVAYFETLGREATKRDFLWLSKDDANARFPNGVEDNTHFSELGACGIARIIAMALQKTDSGKKLVKPDSVDASATVEDATRPLSVRLCVDALRRES